MYKYVSYAHTYTHSLGIENLQFDAIFKPDEQKPVNPSNLLQSLSHVPAFCIQLMQNNAERFLQVCKHSWHVINPHVRLLKLLTAGEYVLNSEK